MEGNNGGCDVSEFVLIRVQGMGFHTRTLINPLNLGQVYVSADFYMCSFFPMTVALRKMLPAKAVLLSYLDSFKREVSKINHSRQVCGIIKFYYLFTDKIHLSNQNLLARKLSLFLISQRKHNYVVGTH